MLALVRAADETVLDESDWTEADLREDWDRLDLTRDAWLVELDACTAGLFTSCGYMPVRWFWRLVIDLDAPVPPQVPAGIEIRTLRDLDEAPAVHAALEEAVVFEKELRG